MTETTDPAAALLALAAAQARGEAVERAAVTATLRAVLDHAAGIPRLRRALREQNDPDVGACLEDMATRAAQDATAAARRFHRRSERLVATLQAISLGAGATAGVAAAIGTVALGSALPMAAAGLLVGAAASWTRLRLSALEDENRRQAEEFERVAALAGRSA